MTRRTGNRHEEMACWYYHHLNYRAWCPQWCGRRPYNIFRSSDILRLFDGIAVRQDQIILFQVKTAKYFDKKVEEQIREFVCPESVIKDYWLIQDNVAKVRRFSLGRSSDFVIDLNTMEISND